MKQFFIILALFSLSYANAQKLKLKDGKVMIDKVHRYDLVKTKADKKGKLEKYELIDLEGQIVLSLIDTIYNYEQLPNEKMPREAYHQYKVISPTAGLTATIPYNPIMRYGKQRLKDLKKVGFFKDHIMDEEKFNAFVEKQIYFVPKTEHEKLLETNDNRKKNYKLTLEKIGPLTERKPGNISLEKITGKSKYHIKDGITTVGQFILTDTDSYRPGVLVYNGEDENIASGTIYVNPEIVNKTPKFKYDLRLNAYGKNDLEKNYKRFFHWGSNHKKPNTIYEKLEVMAQFLIHEGFL